MALISYRAHVALRWRSLLRCRRKELVMAEEIDATRGGHFVLTFEISRMLRAINSGAACTLTRNRNRAQLMSVRFGN